jgi:Kef-type K+ transport system membrane component KefB
MELAATAGLNLPPLQRFAIVTILVLLTPHLMRHVRLPPLIGYILIGVAIGPHALGVVPKHPEAATFMAELGKILLLFFVGLEVDIQQFLRSKAHSVTFGCLTFGLPCAAGMAAGLLLGYPMLTAIMIGVILAPHTMIAYPMVQAAGLHSRLSITVAAGATIIADVLALLLLAICQNTQANGFDLGTVALQLGQMAILILVVTVGFGVTGHWLLAKLGQGEEACFALMLAIVGVGAGLADWLHIEPILGAFLAGLGVNSAVREAEGKEKLVFLGNTFFIPAFFVVTGFSIDLKVFAMTIWENIWLVLFLLAALGLSKWGAAEIAGRVWKMGAADRALATSLTLPHVAATLAAAIVAYQTMNAAGERLIDSTLLNIALVIVVATSIVGPILTDRSVRKLRAGEPVTPPILQGN